MSKRKKFTVLALLAFVLVGALGAKLYSNVVMGDNEWIGLGSTAGRIVFDNQAVDEVNVMDANVGIARSVPDARLHVGSGAHWVAGEVAVAVTEGLAGGVSKYDRGLLVQNRQAAAAQGNYIGLQIDYKPNNGVTQGTAYGVYVGPESGLGGVTTWYPAVFQGGNVGIQDATPSYDLDVDGDVRATGDVLAGDSMFVGSVKDTSEDSARMFTRANSADGGYVFYAIRNFEGQVDIFDDAGGVGPNMVLLAHYLTHSNTTDMYRSGEAVLINGPHAQDTVIIASDGERDILALEFYEGKVYLYTVGAAGHLYDVALEIMWVEN